MLKLKAVLGREHPSYFPTAIFNSVGRGWVGREKPSAKQIAGVLPLFGWIVKNLSFENVSFENVMLVTLLPPAKGGI